jgi:hypothetical protein
MPLLFLAAVVALVVPLAYAVPAAGNATPAVGTCLESRVLPCTVSMSQIYGSTQMAPGIASGSRMKDGTAAVLSRVFGFQMAIEPAAVEMNGDSGDFDFTPNDITKVNRFEWTYRGPEERMAYLAVRSDREVVMTGIAGRRSGSVNVADLLPGAKAVHVMFWTTLRSLPAPVVAERVHGEGFLGNTRLGRIENGTVPCVHVETAKPARCVFTKRSGSWLESRDGHYALVGRPISLNGEPGGDYVVAARINTDGTVPSLQPTRPRDAAGIPSGDELGGIPSLETSQSARNASGGLLQNYATLEVCTSSHPHPDGAMLTRSPSPGVYCYIGRGAALNDNGGSDRGPDGHTLTSVEGGYIHIMRSGGYEVFAAKRPATRNVPMPPRVNPATPLVWRPVASNVRIGN